MSFLSAKAQSARRMSENISQSLMRIWEALASLDKDAEADVGLVEEEIEICLRSCSSLSALARDSREESWGVPMERWDWDWDCELEWEWWLGDLEECGCGRGCDILLWMVVWVFIARGLCDFED